MKSTIKEKNLLLTLLHSKQPKLYRVLAFSECNRVKHVNSFLGDATPNEKGGKHENDSTASPENALIHLNPFYTE